MSDFKVDSIPAGLPVWTILYWAGTDTNSDKYIITGWMYEKG